MPKPPVPAPGRSSPPRDQAHGLRQRFAAAPLCVVPLVHNPLVDGTGVVMERLCAALAALGHRTLVVDAADSATRAHPLAPVDLVACVEPLSADVAYLAAGGLAMQFLDNRATLAGFIDALRTAAAAPAVRADVLLLHAGALDLRRMFAGATPRPLLLAGSRPDSLTHAYTSMKLLSQRLGALAYDLVVAGDVSVRRARGMGERLADCADHFLGAALRRVAVVDPTAPPSTPLGADLTALVAERLHGERTSLESLPLAALPAPSTVRPGARRPTPVGRLN